MNLRPYQLEDLIKCQRDVMSGRNRNLIVWATGLGKTVLMAHIVGRLRKKRALIIVNREELVWQTIDKIKASYPNLNVSVEKAEYHSTPESEVVVASIQTIGSTREEEDGTPIFSQRIQTIDPSTFDVVIVDECHRASSDTFRNALKYFGVYLSDSRYNDQSKMLFGLTATPNRSDNKGLDEFFNHITGVRDIRWGIQNKYLTDIEAYRVETRVDISDVKITAGDFNHRQLERKINTPARNELVVKKYIEITGGEKKSLFFTLDIQHAEDLATELNKQGVKAMSVSSRNSLEKRKEIFDMHKRGEITALTGAMIFCLDSKTEILTSEGWCGVDAMDRDKSVANWWPDSTVTFDNPKAIFRRTQYNGEKLLSLSSPRRDIRVTEDHNMVGFKFNGDLVKIKAKDLKEFGPIRIPTCGVAEPKSFGREQFSANQIPKARFVSYTSSLLRKKGMSHSASTQEAERRYEKKSGLKKKHPQELSLEECSFIGFWIGDGGKYELATGGVEFKISQSLRNIHNITWLDGIISSIGVDSIKRQKKPTRSAKKTNFKYIDWSFPRGTGGGCQERNGLYHIEDYLNKDGSELLWGLSKDQFDSLIYGLWRADGNHKTDEVMGNTIHIYSVNLKFIDMIQAIAATRGWQANIHHKKKRETAHKLSLSKTTWFGYNTGGNKLQESLSCNEMVWCVKSSSGFTITRRNGKVTVLGNCEGYDDPTIEVGCMVRPFRSGLIYRQAVGRVLRPCPAPETLKAMREAGKDPKWIKPAAIIIDFVDVSSRHTLITVPTLFGLSSKVDIKGKRVEDFTKNLEDLMDKLPEKIKKKTKLEEVEDPSVLTGIVERVSLVSIPETPSEISQHSSMSWIKKDETYILNMPTRTMTVKHNSMGGYDVKISMNGVSTFAGSSPTLADAIGKAEKRMTSEEKKSGDNSAAWRANPVSDKQVALLAKIDRAGVSKMNGDINKYKATIKHSMNAGQAQSLISSLLAKRL